MEISKFIQELVKKEKAKIEEQEERQRLIRQDIFMRQLLFNQELKYDMSQNNEQKLRNKYRLFLPKDDIDFF